MFGAWVRYALRNQTNVIFKNPMGCYVLFCADDLNFGLAAVGTNNWEHVFIEPLPASVADWLAEREFNPPKGSRFSKPSSH